MANNSNRAPFNKYTPYANTIVVESGQSLQAAVDAAAAGQNIHLMPSPTAYTADTGSTITITDGINVVGLSTNCRLAANVVLQGSASISSVKIETGYYIEQGGTRYYAQEDGI